MHDIKKIRDNPDNFDLGLRRKGEEPCSNYIISLDKKRRSKILESEEAQAKRNVATKEIQLAKQRNDTENFDKLRKLVSDKKLEIANLEHEAKDLNLNKIKQVNPNAKQSTTLEPQASVRRCALFCR